jgi:hypothetical protein
MLARAALHAGLTFAAAAMMSFFSSPAPAVGEPLAQDSFATADAATNALITALKAGDKRAILHVLGPAAAPLIRSGDPVQDQQVRDSFVQKFEAKHSLVAHGSNAMQLIVGDQDWPLPIPIVQESGQWRFDSKAGAQELVDRAIGRNELMTIRTLLSGVAAQRDYFERIKAGTGTGAYATRIISADGQTDGLYWPVVEGDAPSPLGPLIDQAREDGYPGTVSPDGEPVPYHGYLFRVLTAQGADAPGGMRDYVKDGSMTGGFAFVAWPARYGASGITTFVVGPDGVVFQKDLGKDTAKSVAAMTRFDPDLSWTRVDVKD